MRDKILVRGDALKRARIVSGMTKSELAKRAGINHSSVVRAEQGKSVSPGVARSVCVAFGKSFDELFEITK